jgi:YD repeat-containing protein
VRGRASDTFAYDGLDRLQTVTDPLLRTQSYAYDDANRVTTQTFTDGNSVVFTYDADGNVTSVTSPGKPAHAFGFTPADLMSNYTPPVLSTEAPTTYEYNRDKQPTVIHRPDGSTINFTCDSAGRPPVSWNRSTEFRYAVPRLPSPGGGDSAGQLDYLLPMSRKAGAAGIVALAVGLAMLDSPARAQSSDQPVQPTPPSSYLPPSVAPPAGFHEHDAFYLRLALGPSLLRASWKMGTSDWSIKGIGPAVVMAVGGSLAPNLIVYGELTANFANDPTRNVNGVSTTLNDYQVILAGIGPGATYYLVPANVYFSATLAFSKLSSRYNGPSGSEGSGTELVLFSDMGIGGAFTMGKEWWVSTNWGVGVAGTVRLASMKVPNDSRATAEAFAVVLSATYN